MSEPVLSIRGMVKRFGGLTAVANVDLDVFGGEVVALLGDNGAGKSTLITCISGVHRPDAGTVEMDGSLSAWPISVRRSVFIMVVAGSMRRGRPPRRRARPDHR
jgi:ABC-type sugar transport system ATPase subunit